MYQSRYRSRTLDLVGYSVAELFEDETHPALEIAHVLAVVIDVPVNRFLGDDLKSNAFVLHVGWQLDAAKRVRLSEFVEFEGVPTTAHFLASLPAIDVVANPPDVLARLLLKNSSFFANHFSRHGFGPPRPKIANQVQTGTRTGTRAVWTTKEPLVVRGSFLCKLFILIGLSVVPRGGLEPPRPCGLRILSPLRLPISPSGHLRASCVLQEPGGLTTRNAPIVSALGGFSEFDRWWSKRLPRKKRPLCERASFLGRLFPSSSAVFGIRFLRRSSSTPTSSCPNRRSSIPNQHIASS